MSLKSKSIKILGTTALVTAGLAGASFLVSPVNAASNNPLSEMISALSTRFGIDQTELTSFFAEQREARADARLDALVEDGTLTQTQRDALEAKQDEQQSKREEIENASMTASERREALDTLREEMQTWLDEQGIDLPIGQMGGRGFGPGRGERSMMF